MVRRNHSKIPSLTTLEDYTHDCCKDQCHLFCDNLLKLNNNCNNNNNGMINGMITTIILRTSSYGRKNKHDLTLAGLSNYEATSQRLFKHERILNTKTVYSYIAPTDRGQLEEDDEEEEEEVE
ncbi:hypothetical protein DFA_06741 [Cavenderia fasciculata]|uniref:Uncharacterized protein n=1 Tax=Cavenderia fasciculata TaxID=261658 RepID=F4Q254_CACFS|nr:uncharacterized protein DFA_06741 [Cavenderia fasciculata]EGG18074.1 hypothetical protein DFA_06741 [Cavenderia fasciculata]|eukprot:XP_004366115.1 hypothetical protein DFA_06741 [Cavenderia fasciculata]